MGADRTLLNCRPAQTQPKAKQKDPQHTLQVFVVEISGIEPLTS